ncbi:MAG TPA: EF-hand domain-containing protein [Smithellaceae bacterium]|nr:EF-hand domain-containing protein [Smithellaceae bacterium]
MKNVFRAFVLVFFCAVLGTADESNLRKADTNNDGRINKKEYMHAAKSFFNKIDLNADGILSEDELKTIDKLAVKKFIEEEDINKDGKISSKEFTRAAEKRFRFLDKNSDGLLDFDEINAGAVSEGSKTTPVSPLLIFTF